MEKGVLKLIYDDISFIRYVCHNMGYNIWFYHISSIALYFAEDPFF